MKNFGSTTENDETQMADCRVLINKTITALLQFKG